MQCLIKIEITQLEEVGQYYIQECRHVVAFFPHASTLETVALNPDVSAPYFLQKKDGEDGSASKVAAANLSCKSSYAQ